MPSNCNLVWLDSWGNLRDRVALIYSLTNREKQGAAVSNAYGNKHGFVEACPEIAERRGVPNEKTVPAFAFGSSGLENKYDCHANAAK
jgi:hypothetical protein